MPGTQPGPSKCPEPLCTLEVLPLTSRSPGPRQRALPHLHRSYGLMRQTKTLLSTSVVPSPTGLCSLSSLTAASWPFPTLSLRIFLWMLGPIPRRFSWCTDSFLPRRHRPSPTSERLGTQQYPYCNFVRRLFRGCSHSLMFRPPDLLATQVAPTADRLPVLRAAVAFTSTHISVRYLPEQWIC